MNFLKQDCETRENLDMLISEIKEELKICISNYLWFILRQEEESNNTGLYCPRVGPQDYKGTFLTICFKSYSINQNNILTKLLTC